MPGYTYEILASIVVIASLIGIAFMSRVERARQGNLIGSFAVLAAIIITTLEFQLVSFVDIYIGIAIGALLGLYMAKTVKMIQMPQMVGLLNGLGGGASMIAGIITVMYGQNLNYFTEATAVLAIIVGGITFSGSMVAAAKLQGLIPSRSKVYPYHSEIVYILLAISLLSTVMTVVSVDNDLLWIVVASVVSLAFGYFFAIRVGGADMPITISLLNSGSGLAGAIAGVALNDPLLVAIGGIVGASGLLLTQIMCQSMNSSLTHVLLGHTSQTHAPKKSEAKPAQDPKKAGIEAKAPSYAEHLAAAKRVIIVPGYGMALSQAQSLVKDLYSKLTADGKETDFAIHPVAGRMPGHMNVLLAEVDIPYDKMREMDDINPEFAETDVVIVVGANDVVNPAAHFAEGTTIYGMPILEVQNASHIIICNLDTKPGYAGVENSLYTEDNVELLLGDAKESLKKLLQYSEVKAESGEVKQQTDLPEYLDIVDKAKRVIIVPGYGMALSQAQGLVKALYDDFTQSGKETDFAIHPVAGRMPGHMNVLLAEVDIPYDKLREMDDINPEFAEADLVIIVGANDVVNPAAHTAEGTAIYGMPILEVQDASHIIICNLDTKPGYAGVDNSLYEAGNVTLLLGDAKESIKKILDRAEMKALTAKDEPSDEEEYAKRLLGAERVIIVPGYGMALSQAQSLVKSLHDKLVNAGKKVDFAIHPVAGRMPGHMNVLLAEVDIPYDKLREMDDINPEFSKTDVVIVVGANDVINPAAHTAEGTAIYGMPILEVENANHIIICNLDTKPGYAGVENSLYDASNVTLLLGDAKESLKILIDVEAEKDKTPDAVKAEETDYKQLLFEVKRVIIVPGYGMALSQAQRLVKSLYNKLVDEGKKVDFAIHPVAGRMPGHMNVLLAEVDVPYDKLREMDDINPEFAETDVVIVVGANDVINPAAHTAEGTAIYGMPILEVAQARHIIICNLDTSPGYAGVENALYEADNVTLLLGDAKESLQKLMQ